MHKELITAYMTDKHEQNRIRVEQQEILFDFYTGNTYNIKQYLEDDLLKTFPQGYLDDFQSVYINFVPKLINQLAVVYREPAERNLTNGQEFKPKDDTDESKQAMIDAKAKNNEMLEEATKRYINLLPDDMNTVDKTAHRYAKAFTTSLTRTRWDNGIVYDVMGSHLFNVKTDGDNPYKMLELSYTRDIVLNDKEMKVAVFWTDTEHWMEELVNTGTKEKPIIARVGRMSVMGRADNDFTNYYGVIPFAVLRLDKTGDFWGNGAMDIVDCNRNINVLLTDLVNATIMQAWGTPVAIDMELGSQGGQSKEGETTVAPQILVGPKHPMIGRTVAGMTENPSFSYANASPLIKEVWDLIDSQIKQIASIKGLNPNSFLADAKATSGYSKIIDSLEQLELRLDDIEPCLTYEKERFEITRKVANYHNGSGINGADAKKRIDEKLELLVDFKEIGIPETMDEKIKRRNEGLAKNLITYVDIIREDNPDLSIEEAESRLADNKEKNDLYRIVNVDENADIEGKDESN